MGMFDNIIREFFFMLDKMIYSLIAIIYNLLLRLAGATDEGTIQIISTKTIEAISNRIYAFLLIFLVFRISISALNYIANPSTFDNGETGVKGLFKHIFMALALIVVLPIAFNIGRIVQERILADGLIVSIILNGENSTEDLGDGPPVIYTGYENMGSEIAYITFKAFFSPICTDTTYSVSNVSENTNNCEAQKKLDEIEKEFHEVKRRNSDAVRGIHLFDNVKNETQKLETGKQYLFQYMFGISTLTGGFLAWVLIVFCLDIGIRMVKLAVLEVIHPIVIMAYLNPKSPTLKNWTKEYISTYTIIFVRLFIIFMSILIISEITKNDIFRNSKLMLVFVILSILMASKEIPKMVASIFNVKSSFSLNPMKRIAQAPLLGNIVQKGVVAGGLLAGGAVLGTANIAGRAIGQGAKALGKSASSATGAAYSGLKNTKVYNADGDEIDFQSNGTNQKPNFVERYRGFNRGAYQTGFTEKIKDNIEHVSDLYKDSMVDKSIRKTKAIAATSVGKDGVTLKSISDAIATIDPGSYKARKDTEKRANINKIKSDLKSAFEDSIMAKYKIQIEPGIIPVYDKASDSFVEDGNGGFNKLQEPMKAKDMKLYLIKFSEALTELATTVSEKQQQIENLKFEQSQLNVTDRAIQAHNDLANNNVTAAQAKDEDYKTQITDQLKQAKKAKNTSEIIRLKGIQNAITSYNNLSQTEINNYVTKEAKTVEISTIQNEVNALFNKQKELQTGVNRINKAKADIEKNTSEK